MRIDYSIVELKLRFIAKILKDSIVVKILNHVSEHTDIQSSKVAKDLRINMDIYYNRLRKLVSIGAINKTKMSSGRVTLSVGSEWRNTMQYLSNQYTIDQDSIKN